MNYVSRYKNHDYRFYLNDHQKNIAEKITKKINEKLLGKVVTKISLLKNYCIAEEYHQKYLDKN